MSENTCWYDEFESPSNTDDKYGKYEVPFHTLEKHGKEFDAEHDAGINNPESRHRDKILDQIATPTPVRRCAKCLTTEPLHDRKLLVPPTEPCRMAGLFCWPSPGASNPAQGVRRRSVNRHVSHGLKPRQWAFKTKAHGSSRTRQLDQDRR